ncbi:MAG: membrane dipeptidase [Clostridia bacterium]|nr:membrane dipeptidase [Clostridia bacterium]
MFIADAHCDTLYEIGICHTAPERCVITPDKLEKGGVGLQTFALFAGKHGTEGTAYQDGLDMLAVVPQLKVPLLLDDLPDAPPATPTGILSCEGGEMFEGSIERFHEFMARGRLRMIALTWNFENEIGYPALGGEKKGLKPFGFELLREMDAAGVRADVSHLNEAGFWDLMDRAELAPIASHSDCRWLCDTPRNLTKDQVRAIIDRNGFIGINFYANFLHPEGKATLDDVLRHIDAICELGGERVLGFGSDFDGIDSWPDGLGDPTGFPAVLDLLRRHGYPEETLQNIAGLNLWRVLKESEAHRR